MFHKLAAHRKCMIFKWHCHDYCSVFFLVPSGTMGCTASTLHWIETYKSKHGLCGPLILVVDHV